MSYKRLHSRIKGGTKSSFEHAANAFEADGPLHTPTFMPDINHPASDYQNEVEKIRLQDAKLGLTFDRLNRHQRHAVFYDAHNTMLSAMVGSGKTTVLIAKIFHLHFIKGIPFKEMVVLTFTNKAAREIKERIGTFLGDESEDINEELRYFGTFHAVARQLLQEQSHLESIGFKPGFTIIDEQEKQNLLERLIAQENFNIKYQNKITKRWRKYLQSGETKMGNMKNEDDLVSLVHLAQKEKQDINTMDFDDLITQCNELQKKHPAPAPQWIIVDEFQDCNEEQLHLIENIRGENTQLFVVGDQNQSIYGWRGSKEHLFEETQKRWHATWMELPQNYRSTKTIVTAAETLLQHNQSALIATRHDGEAIDLVRHFDDQQEAYYFREQLSALQQTTDLNTVAILFRTHQQIGIVETVLKQASLPYQLVKRADLHEDKALSFLLSIFKSSINPNDFDAGLSLLCNTTFGVVKRSQSIIKKLQNRASGTSVLPAAILHLEKQKSPSTEFIKLLEKVELFASGFLTLQDTTAQDLIDFLELRTILKPTSIHYKAYITSITEAWNQLSQYLQQQGWGNPSQSFVTAIGQVALEGTFQINDRIKEKEVEGVHLLTIHASKGLEFDRVYIAGANTGVIPLTQHQKGSEDLKEEKRLLFVAMTRGKNHVEIGWHAKPTMRNTTASPSYFLNNIPEELLHRRTAKDTTVTEIKDEWSIGTHVKHKKYGNGRVTSVDDKALSCNFDAIGEKVFSRAFAKALLVKVD